jgi:hypothetical protein
VRTSITGTVVNSAQHWTSSSISSAPRSRGNNRQRGLRNVQPQHEPEPLQLDLL